MAAFNDLPQRKWAEQPLSWNGRYVFNWFSNFQPGERSNRLGELEFRTVEEAYQAAKTRDQDQRRRFVDIGASASKRLGRTIHIRDDWEYVAIAAMDFCLRQKFQPGTPEADMLLESPGVPVEWNNWGDVRFGVEVKSRTGRNVLGILLYIIRREIQLTGRLNPGAPEEHWLQRQEALFPHIIRVGNAAAEKDLQREPELF